MREVYNRKTTITGLYLLGHLNTDACQLQCGTQSQYVGLSHESLVNEGLSHDYPA